MSCEYQCRLLCVMHIRTRETFIDRYITGNEKETWTVKSQPVCGSPALRTIAILVGGSVRLSVQHGNLVWARDGKNAHHERFHYSGTVRRRRSSITMLLRMADTHFLFSLFVMYVAEQGNLFQMRLVHRISNAMQRHGHTVETRSP